MIDDYVLGCGHEHVHTDGYRPRSRSHDDGPLTGLFLGGIGASVCSRDLDGRFARWHLQNGYHVRQIIDQAFFALRWKAGNDSGYFRLAGSGPHAAEGKRDVRSLFPVVRESYDAAGVLSAEAEFFSPVFPGDTKASVLPVWYCAVTVTNISHGPADADIAWFWPNLLGWRVQQVTPAERGACWPGQTHSGNTASVFGVDDISGVIQQRFPGRPVTDEMEGEIALCTYGQPGERVSVLPCCKAGQNLIDRSPEHQEYTAAWAEAQFASQGVLPGEGFTWNAHWDEALCSAVSRGDTLAAGESRTWSFCLAADMPLVKFGSGRRWYRKYTRWFGRRGRGASGIARYAAEHQSRFREEISQWHSNCFTSVDADRRTVAMLINELYLMQGGGSVWTEAAYEDDALEPPLLGGGEHCALLEGYDVGYCYYNTLDLWTYGWYGVSRWWPEFASSVFRDFLDAAEVEIPDLRMIYRDEQMRPMLTRGKLPHDLGAPMEDPWHLINGYQMRDDSNTWKDHNQGFLISFYLHVKMHGKTLTLDEWRKVRCAGRFVISQDADKDGLPRHDIFGDSTWDNLGIKGVSAFSGTLNLACLAVLAQWAGEMGDDSFAALCLERLALGQRTLMSTLWNGRYFRLCEEGRYAQCIMADGVLGVYLADIAGLEGYLEEIDRDHVKSHLKAFYEINMMQCCSGRIGPLLAASPGRTVFDGDGGDELQVNEVIVGSAWSAAAMMKHYGLHQQYQRIAEVLYRTVYGEGGLQFRTPAAYDPQGRFRAPMNMRPLAAWFTAWESGGT